MLKAQIRPARATDKPAIRAVCARAWEGEDYVPKVWDEWLADPYGQLVVAEVDNRVVALGKLSRLADGEWWLEGLRVDPAFRRQGVAGQLQAHLVEKVRQVGRGVVRYGTHSTNEPVHRIAAQDGLRHTATYYRYRADPLSIADIPLLRQLAKADLAQCWALINDTNRYRAAGGLYEANWKWKSLTRERLANHLEAGDGWGLEIGGELGGLALVLHWAREGVLNLGYVDGLDKVLVTVLQELRGLTLQQGYTELWFKPVEEPALVAAVEAAGYERGADRDIWIFELQLN